MTTPEQFSEIGPEVDQEVIYAVYEAEYELNPDPETRPHNLVILTLHFPNGTTMKVSLCPIIGTTVCGGIATEAEEYLENYIEDLYRD